MSIVSIPSGLVFGLFGIGQQRFDVMERSDSSGADAARLLAPPRWTVAAASPANLPLSSAGKWDGWLLQGRGSVNVYAIYDVVRPTPQGGVTGTLKVVGDVPAGATSMTLTGNLTNLGFDAGDWMQIGSGVGTSHYCKATADADPAGAGGAFTWTSFTWTSFSWIDANTVTVSFEPPTRQAFVQGTLVTINQPLGYFRRRGDSYASQYVPGFNAQGGYAADFLETFSP